MWTRQEGPEAAVFDQATGMLYRLNASALAIWDLCDGDTELDEIIDAITELTGSSRPEVAAEVEATLRRLLDLGLIHVN